MEGVRWTNEDDEEEDFLESSKAENESIWEAPEEAEEEPSWFESQQESRAEDFLSIVRGEKEDEEAEQPGESFMGKLIGEKPEDIQEEDGEALEATVVPEQTPEAEQEETPLETEDLPIDDLEQPSTESLGPEAEDEAPPEIIEEEPIDQPEEAEPILTHAQEEEDQEPQSEEEPPISGGEVFDEPTEDQPEQSQDEEPIDQPEEIEPVAPQAQETEEEPQAAEEEPNSYEDNEPSDNPEESTQDDGGEEPPEEPPTEPESNGNDPENPNPNNQQIVPENINVTHEHNAAGAGIVGVLLGAEYFGRKRADRKLRKEIDKNKKAGEESVEEFEDRMKILEEEQRVQAEEQEKLNKLSSERNNQIFEMEQDREKPKAAEVQSVSGENFELEEEESEGRERKAGQKLETSIEDSVEEVKFKNQEIGGELALDSRHESSSQKDDGSAADSMVYSASSPSHISDVISNNEIAKAESFKNTENIAGSDNQKEEQRFNHAHESYMSSVQAGVVIGLIIVVFVAILFFFG